MLRLSPSQIATYRRCSLQWWFAYVARIKMKPRGVMTQGRAVHRGVQVGLDEKRETGALPPVSVVQDATAEAFDRDAPLTIWEDGERPEALKDQAVALAALHHREVAPSIDPLFVEHQLQATLEDGLQVTMIADVVEADATIRDHKTSSRRIDPESLRTDVQLAAYTLGFEQTLGMPIRAVRLDRLITTKTPQIQQEEIPRAQVDTARLQAVASGVATAIERRVFVPCDDVRVCGWCGYRPICWGARWWEYLKDGGIDVARDAAARALHDQLLPQDA
jgi:CRISPR/Cas system-associated exonuclease Cas4 (RecB family)